jgi:ribosomal protein L11 methyltransferase
MIEALKNTIYNVVIDAKKKMTPGEVEKAVVRATRVNRKTVKQAIKDLIGAGQLSYTYVYGTTFLEPSFDRPVRISNRIVIKPPQKTYQAQPGEVIVNVAAGVAFGNGAHPTTCLALEALDCALDDNLCLQSDGPLTGLDVGTGTGVLAIALAMLGVQKVVGVDIDPCAISEARYNVSLNGLSEQVTISYTPLKDIKGPYSVVLANLAYPTLMRISAVLAAKMVRDGVLILSGFKGEVSAGLAEAYAQHGLRLVCEATEREWVCMTLCKKVLE